jgi:CMP-N,N'-diacetyllegionaminic acid synthase
MVLSMTGQRKDLKVLGLIPARGGSKGISKKNIISLAGIPLIQYTIDAAKKSDLLSDFIVSTDSPEIAEVAKKLGAKVPFIRPAELATDSAKSQDVALHALDSYDPEGTFDYLLLLQPTAPFRSAEDIDEAIRLATRHDASSVVSFSHVETHHPYYMYFLNQPASKSDSPRVRQAFDYKVGTPRQDFPPMVYRNGAIYMTKVSYLRSSHSFVSQDIVPYLMPSLSSINIDEKDDILYAEFILSRKEESD